MKSTMMKNTVVRLENTNKGHFKFWEAHIKSRTVTVHWGRIGRSSRSKRYSFHSNFEAQDFMDQMVSQKLRRGYRIDRCGLLAA